ncbi:MAG: acyltransferase family protein [Rhodoferax sp.]|uniref:acyltransferase family protein n=1 Tax=Rhodoferax sp. TaxID=50421 RepID=UPI0027230587|nr:acyltransferase family protein [Rhodoferax sp.]MDO8450422.1 acyltransferase family protein [Rhodoferax sp.]
MHNAHPVYRPDIDGLRAIAILSVVIYHAFPTHLRGGFVGVDVFFVISGFLISSIIFRSLQRGDFSFGEFYARRVRRIFPALILVLAASYTIGWFVLLPDEFKQLGKHMAAGAGFVQNIVLHQEAGYFDTASELKPLMHLWSLSIEEQFYLVFPLLIWGAWRLGLNALSVALLLILLSFGLNLGGIERNATKVFFMPHTRFWELLAGSVLAYVQLFKSAPLAYWLQRCVFHPLVFRHPPAAERRDAILNNLLAFGGLLLIVAAVFGLHKGKLYPGGWALFPVLGACLLILAGSGAWVNRKILANRWVVFVGLISYPLYLWHWPLLSFARLMEGETPSRNIRMAVVALSFVLAWLTYRMLERPLRRGEKTWRTTAVLCALISLVGCVGYMTFKHDGFRFRYQQLTANNAQFDWGSNNGNAGCKESYPDFSTSYCAKSKPTEPTIFLVGDSHSNHLYPGLAEVTLPTRDTVLHLSEHSCVPFFDVTTAIQGQPVFCTQLRNRALELAENIESVRTVILAARWPIYISGKDYSPHVEVKKHLAINLTGNSEITNSSAVFEIAMKATIERLLAKNKTIIFVLDVPELDFDPKSCVDNRPARLTNRIKQPCAVPRQEFDDRNRDYRSLVRSILEKYPQIKVFDAATELCDLQWCWAMKDNQMLYRDNNHLSVQGSLFIARGLAKMIQKQ